MGYRINFSNADFTIQNPEDALTTVNNEYGEDYSSLVEALDKTGRWQADERTSEPKELIITGFNGQKSGFGEEEILQVIAPYCQNGSYIEMTGEMGEKWRWIVQDDEIREITPEIEWGMET